MPVIALLVAVVAIIGSVWGRDAALVAAAISGMAVLFGYLALTAPPRR